VFAGAAEVVAIGTKFDVRLEGDATVVTVLEGRVAVGPSLLLKKLGPQSARSTHHDLSSWAPTSR